MSCVFFFSSSACLKKELFISAHIRFLPPKPFLPTNDDPEAYNGQMFGQLLCEQISLVGVQRGISEAGGRTEAPWR